jgi:hypothetical protein
MPVCFRRLRLSFGEKTQDIDLQLVYELKGCGEKRSFFYNIRSPKLLFGHTIAKQKVQYDGKSCTLASLGVFGKIRGENCGSGANSLTRRRNFVKCNSFYEKGILRIACELCLSMN